MVSTLVRMEQEVKRLAGDDVDASDIAELPGAIGVSMRESMTRLAMLTAQLQRSEKFASTIVDAGPPGVGPDGAVALAIHFGCCTAAAIVFRCRNSNNLAPQQDRDHSAR